MSATDTVLERNAARSKELGERHLTISPDLRAIILACADHRVDPAHVLGLDLGEAVVLRNPGARVTPAFMQNLAVLAVVGSTYGLEPGFELIVMHHTDCGLKRLDSPDYAAMMAGYFGVDEDAIPEKHLAEPRAAVQADLDALRANPLMPPTLIASGVVYDIASGSVEVVCPPAPLGAGG
jgi:carbonic anhydrase